MASTYLEWLNEATPTRWWHDSGNPDEIALGKARGALGVTTNPGPDLPYLPHESRILG